MSGFTCPAGHPTKSGDYCDVCGAPVDATAKPAENADPEATSTGLSLPGPAPTRDCPHCGEASPKDALFCEACGYDFTTGQLPAAGAAPVGHPAATTAAPAGPVEWVAEVWVDPDWYAHEAVSSTDPCPNAGPPRIVPLRGTSLLIGRTSVSRNVQPAVDCSTDSAVSRRHAELTFEGGHWYVEDLSSVNGTYVGASGAPLPDAPIEPGKRKALADNDRVYVGAWTRLVIRNATSEERGTP